MVVSEVSNIYSTAFINPAYNHTFLALIPKTSNAAIVEQFRPISLCNVFLKIVTKIIANRLRGVLEDIIHPSQAAFVPN